MRKFLYVAVFMATILSTDSKMNPTRQETALKKPNISFSLEDSIDSTISIASFNIRDFGKTKSEKADVMRVLTDIVQQYDITAIQEVSDIKGETIPYFVAALNARGRSYSFVISPRVGKESAAEQYAFVYNTKKIEYTGKSFIWADSYNLFERDPFIAQFRSANFDFILVNVHTRPTNAEKEVMALEYVMQDADNYFADDKDVIVLGDFNADGDSFSEKITNGFRGPQYNWVIDDSQDTTVAKNSNTYDRIVFKKQFTQEDYAGKAGVFRFDSFFGLTQQQAMTISDHYPVWALFYTNKDTD